MHHPNVTMLLANPYRPDLRVQREAFSLRNEGYKVRIIAWDRLAEFTETEDDEYIEIQRIQHIRSIYYGGIRQITVMPRFWEAAVKMTLLEKPDVVHCHDLDTLYAGVRLKQILGCPLVYDAHEYYPAMMSLYLPRFIVNWLSRLERQLMHQTDMILTASETLARMYKAQGFSPVFHIPNTPSLARFDQVKQDHIRQKRVELGIKDDELGVAYIGGFTRNRVILPLIEAVKGLERVRLFLWGDGIQRAKVEQLIQHVPNANYLGWLPPESVPLHTKTIDVIFYALKPDFPGGIYNAPNALGNVMAAAKPIIANDIGDLGAIIRREKCGMLLNEVSVQNIREAILALQKDPESCRRLGLAGRQAAEREFQWSETEKTLFTAYSGLIKPNNSN